MIPTFNRLADAIQYASSTPASSTAGAQYVIASDAEIGSHRFKKYHVGGLVDLYNFISMNDISAYEVIIRPNVFLYFDIELGSKMDILDVDYISQIIDQCLVEQWSDASNPEFPGMHSYICEIIKDLSVYALSDTEMIFIGQELIAMIKEFVELVFKQQKDSQIIDIYSACRESKLSYHIIHRYVS